MFRKRHSLVWRIALPFALLLVLTMGMLSVFLSNYFRESYLEISKQNLQAESRLVADRISILMGDQAGGLTVDGMAKHYADLLNVRVTIIDTNGNVISESNFSAEEMENHLNRPEIQQALNGITSTETRFSDTLQMPMLYSAAPILQNGKVIGAARLAISLHTIQNNLNLIGQTVLMAAGIILGLGLLLAILIANYTIYPLKQLTQVVQQITDGQVQVNEMTPPTRRDEIGRLHEAFLTMARQLKDQIDELKTERGKSEAVLGNMTDGIIIVDAEGIVQLINPAALRLFNTKEANALGKSLIEVVRNHQIIELWRKSRINSEQETVTLETTPERLFVQGIASPLHNALPDMTLLLFQDLTRVRRLETVRRDFVSNVSHELRTPLASLKALTETLQEGALEDPPAARRFLQRMETEIDNLTQMVHELLELSRIEFEPRAA